MKNFKLNYRISTGLLTVMMFGSAMMYVFGHDHVSTVFESIGYPVYIIYPLALVKILGLIAIWTDKSKALKEWAYAGFFFDFVLAFFAHLMIGDGEFGGAVIAMIILMISYYYWKKDTIA